MQSSAEEPQGIRSVLPQDLFVKCQLNDSRGSTDTVQFGPSLCKRCRSELGLLKAGMHAQFFDCLHHLARKDKDELKRFVSESAFQHVISYQVSNHSLVRESSLWSVWELSRHLLECKSC